MTDAEFRQLVITEAGGRATPNQETWVRSPEICERWHEMLRTILADCNTERASLDQWLEEIRRRTERFGGGAEYSRATHEHARRISAVSKVIRIVQARISEAAALCSAHHPPPLPPPATAPELIMPTSQSGQAQSAVTRLHEVKRELGQANAEIDRLRKELAKLGKDNHSISAFDRQKAINRQLNEDNEILRVWGHQWRSVAEQLVVACQTALQHENARGEQASLELITTLGQLLRSVIAVPLYPPRRKTWQEYLDLPQDAVLTPMEGLAS